LNFLSAFHEQKDEDLIFEKYSEPIIRCLGLEVVGGTLKVKNEVVIPEKSQDVLSLVSNLSEITIRGKGPTRIGARMARPEKAKERKMRPP
jgi:DNA polymerase II large subunit